MPTLTFETPEGLIERLEAAVMADWEASGRAFGERRDPIDDAESDGWCVVRSPACFVAVSREPLMLWMNPLETRVLEWPHERRTRPRPGASRFLAMLPTATSELLTVAAARLGLAGDPHAHASRWLKDVDWALAEVDPATSAKAQAMLDRWQPSGSVENAVERELFMAADRAERHWKESVPVQTLLLRLMATGGPVRPPEVQTAARGTLERLEVLATEAAEALDPDLLFQQPFRQRLQETLRVWVHLMDLSVKSLVVPGGRRPFPTAGQDLELRFQFPPRLLWLWVRAARRLAEAARSGMLVGQVDADLVSVDLTALDEHRHEKLIGVVVLAAVLLQYNQGEPELQEEIAEIAERVLPAVLDPTLLGLHPSDRGRRAKRLQQMLPRALAMGRELQRRGLSLAAASTARLRALQVGAGGETDGTLHFSFPFKLGPEQPLPYAHLLTARSFDQVAPIFE
jgi:hypothetical protein